MGRRSTRIRYFGVSLALALVAVGVLLIFADMSGAVMADVDPNSVTLVDGQMQAVITWPAGGADVRTGQITLPLGYQKETQVPIDILPDGTVELDQSIQGFSLPPAPLVIGVAAIGAVLGLVSVGSVHGYGYVQGAGEFGTMPPGEPRRSTYRPTGSDSLRVAPDRRPRSRSRLPRR
jgi:hypothetical protein